MKTPVCRACDNLIVEGDRTVPSFVDGTPIHTVCPIFKCFHGYSHSKNCPLCTGVDS